VGRGTLITERTLTITSASVPRVRPKGSFLSREDTENPGWRNGMKGWCEQAANEGMLHPEASLLSEGLCPGSDCRGSKFRNPGKGQNLKQSLINKYFAPGVQ